MQAASFTRVVFPVTGLALGSYSIDSASCDRLTGENNGDAITYLGGALTGGNSVLAHSLSPWTGFAVLCGYAAVLIGFAAWRLRRVDA